MAAPSRRRGQSAVEAMLCVPLVAMTIMVMYYLWSIVWASENAHLRAREYVLHGETYLGSRGSDVSGNHPFDGVNYTRADDSEFPFEAEARDESLGVFGTREQIRTTATITDK
jgi:hypothetical protein